MQGLVDVIDAIPEGINIFHMCTYKCLVFCSNTLEIIFISDYQAHGLLLQLLSIKFLTDTFPNTVHIMLTIESKIEKIVLYLNKTIQYMFMFIVNIQI